MPTTQDSSAPNASSSDQSVPLKAAASKEGEDSVLYSSLEYEYGRL